MIDHAYYQQKDWEEEIMGEEEERTACVICGYYPLCKVNLVRECSFYTEE